MLGPIWKSLLVHGSGELGLCPESKEECWRLFFFFFFWRGVSFVLVV